jgi:c-di-GMP-related signal transduction protein
MLLGLDVLCDGRRAVVNCTRDILLKDYVTLLPAEQAVVEILETVPVDDLVMAAWRRLKESVYTIALDDFGMNDPREALTDVADIIKVGLRETSPADAGAMVKRYGPWRAPCRRKRCARHALAIFGRMRGPSLDPAGGHARCWTRQDHRPGALMVRARFCELDSPKIPHGDFDLFLLGMLSMMDVILEIPMSQVLDNVPLDQESKAVLLGGASRLRRSINSCWPKSPASGRPPVNWPRNSISPNAKSRSVTGKPYNGNAR